MQKRRIMRTEERNLPRIQGNLHNGGNIGLIVMYQVKVIREKSEGVEEVNAYVKA